jgi:hypothetical protein
MKIQELRNLIRTEVRKAVNESQLTEGALLSKITPTPSGEFKEAVIALENYLKATGGEFDYNELAYLIIDIKDAGANEGY